MFNDADKFTGIFAYFNFGGRHISDKGSPLFDIPRLKKSAEDHKLSFNRSACRNNGLADRILP